MKRLFCVFLLALIFPATVIAEVVVKEEPLTWGKTARLPGDHLYQNLCAACHNSDGTGNGKASDALGIGAPDLTHIAARNDGVFPRGEIELLIANGDFRTLHGASPMPDWEQQFTSVYFRTARNPLRREAYARDRIRELSNYIEAIQQPN
jgi:mono/diheme cytochrome c family protein